MDTLRWPARCGPATLAATALCVVALGGCSSLRDRSGAATASATTTGAELPIARSDASQVTRLPPLETSGANTIALVTNNKEAPRPSGPVRTVGFADELQQPRNLRTPRIDAAVAPPEPAKPADPVPAESVDPAKPVEPPGRPDRLPIDLPTALQLADANNLQVALAREQVRQALAVEDAARALWLPSLRGGVHWDHHEGPLQDTVGNVLNVNRSSLYSGAGAMAVGSGPPMVPGIVANFHLADALFQPLAARQQARSRQRAAAATTNDVLLSVSLAYLELLRWTQDVAIARQTRDDAQELARLTEVYAKSGQGNAADADRAQTELASRENDLQGSLEAQQVASARLAQSLRLDPTVQLESLEPHVAPIDVVSLDAPLGELVALGLTNRPELSENRLLVSAAVERMRRERYSSLMPSVFLGTSYGGFGGGLGGDLRDFDGRFDFDTFAYWELRNAGLGDAAVRRNAASQVRQARLRQMATLDLVAREVVETHTQVHFRRGQVDTARRGAEAAKLSYQRNLERIKGGQGLPIEVLQSIQALAEARREYLRAVIDYDAAQFSLQRALGWPVQAGVPSDAKQGGTP